MPDPTLVLLPAPRLLDRRPGTLAVAEHRPAGDVGRFPAAAALAVGVGATVRFRHDPAVRPQGYRLTIATDGIDLAAADPAGATYAVRTLTQIAGHHPDALPCLSVDDWPDFPVRGVMLDVSRDKVPTMATLFALVDRLAGWKVNQLQLYTEHTFAYSGHRAVWEHASPITADEVRQLDAFCRERFVELVPNQNSFGHMERWLKHPAYAPLAEAIDGAQTPWGFRWPGPFSLCPTDPASFALLAELYDELLPNFSSGWFNVGCDETFDVGQGRSKAECDRRGTPAVYVEFLRRVNELVTARGRRMMFWGDVILHSPDRIADLPEGAVALQWGYEASHPFDKEGAAFAAAGVPYYVCPGTSAWNSFAGRTDNAVANVTAAAASGLAHGAVGYLITDWGDNGHLQYLPASYVGFAAGAARSWCLSSNRDLDVPAVLDRFAVPGLGRAWHDLGNAYQACGRTPHNAAALFRVMVPSPMIPNPTDGLTADGLDATDAAVDAALALARPDGSLAYDELAHAARLIRRCTALARTRMNLAPADDSAVPELVAEHRRLWLARNRPGGLDDSAARIR